MNYSFTNPYMQTPYYNQQPMNNVYNNTQPQISNNNNNNNIFPLTFVNTKEDIERYIVNPNGAIFLFCEPLQVLVIKKADNLGRYSYETLSIVKQQAQSNNNADFALKTDLIALNTKIEELYKKFDQMTNGVDTNVQQ